MSTLDKSEAREAVRASARLGRMANGVKRAWGELGWLAVLGVWEADIEGAAGSAAPLLDHLTFKACTVKSSANMMQ